MNAIEEAAKRLEQGWCKNELAEHVPGVGDKFCAVGAVASAELELTTKYIDENEYKVYKMLKTSDSIKALAQEVVESGFYDDSSQEFIEDLYAHGQYDEIVYTFNDSQETVEPVLELFRKAAKRL
jgi:hypothetical protein